MGKKEILFLKEEDIINNGWKLLKTRSTDKPISKEEFAVILKGYDKLYKKMKRLVKITDRQQAEMKILNEKISEQNDELIKTNKEKTDFFINIAHEIKTPLTLISNYLSKYIKEKGLNEDLSIIRQNFDMLKNNIINFLDFEKLDRKQIFYNHNQIVHLTDLLKEKIKLFRGIAEKKEIKLRTDIDSEVYMKIDPTAMDRVLNNLIDNAIKYTDTDGFIYISLKVIGKKIQLSIKDTGIGIAAGDTGNIFEPYYQISHKKRNIQGIGMGLNIVKKIIDEIGATIEVRSQLNKGTEFIIGLDRYIPVAEDDIQENTNLIHPVFLSGNVKLKEENIVKGRYNILIVEDNLEMLAYLQDILSNKYNIFCAINGKVGLERIKSIPLPDLILSDIMMDEMDGYKFYNELIKIDTFGSIPFIFITAKSSQEEKIRAISHGAVDFISKPFDINELLAKIESIIKVKEAQRKREEMDMKTRIIRAIRNKETDDDFYTLEDNCRKYGITRREKEVIKLILDGKEDKEIACELNITYYTVRSHINNIYEKCGVQNKVELINKIKNI